MKRYAAHYNINAPKCLIVPVRLFGSEASCDIRWEDETGESYHLRNKFFICENLVPLDSILDGDLTDQWIHHYASNLVSTRTSQLKQNPA